MHYVQDVEDNYYYYYYFTKLLLIWKLRVWFSHRAVCGEQPVRTGLTQSEQWEIAVNYKRPFCCSICNRRSSLLHNDPGMAVQRVPAVL